ncbi:TPM domain-containing protein [Amylibacter sp. SFDW26]|uniref:TPM domain-containing protein n=1 Tax=Amylibacter sp. SFDW26 TaxID=2652722 RepID=UPI0012616CA5|nr:TPM domain-containing protein [Amylibacter sp. SFDW26]KAB7616122.1 TPM domain-containing protein [Amylibacter sp. SFDW26]
MRALYKYIIVVTLVIPTLSFAQSYPAPLSPYVSDYANIIDAQTEARITQSLQNLKAAKGVEMRVVTINSVSDYGHTSSVPDFTTSMINTWGIGDASRNDGILFLTSIEDREMFIGLGSGYTPVYDDRMDRVFEYYVKPYFKNEDYAQGIEVGVLETIKRTDVEFVGAHQNDSFISKFIHYFVIGFIGIAGIRIILGFINRRRMRNAAGATTHSAQRSDSNQTSDRDSPNGGGSSGGGGGGSSGGGGGGGW